MSGASPFTRTDRAGPLRGLRVVELASIGPGPFCGMLLADLGADVIRVDRPDADPARPPLEAEVVNRSRRSMIVDLKKPDGVALMLDIVRHADVLIEGFRPGVTERLGLGPDACRAVNPALVYGRATGWGQDGPLATIAGHDISYLAVTGALHAIGDPGAPPPPPLNYVGDNAGGGMLLALGVVAAAMRARTTGAGQVVDAAIVDGGSVLTALFHGRIAGGWWRDERGVNTLDGGAPYYASYQCADGRYIAVGALEDKFQAELLDRLGFAPDDEIRDQLSDRAHWPAARDRLARVFAARTRDEWIDALGGDSCTAPVLSFAEAPHHPHLRARQTYLNVGGVVQPAPAPRFSADRPAVPTPPPAPGAHTMAILEAMGLRPARIDALLGSGAVRSELRR